MFDSIFSRKARERAQQVQGQTDDRLARYRSLLANAKPNQTAVDQVVKLGGELGFDADDIDRHHQAIQQVGEFDAILADDAIGKARKAETAVRETQGPLMAKHEQDRVRMRQERLDYDRAIGGAQGELGRLTEAHIGRQRLREANASLFGLPEPEPEPEPKVYGNVYAASGELTPST